MTMPPNGTAVAIAAALEGAESLPVFQEAVRSFAASFGYDRFVLFSASPTRDEVVERIYWVEGDWFGEGEPVDAETYVRGCPVTRHILEAREPFFWIKTMEANGELYRVVRSPWGRGIHGLQIPIFGPLGLEGAMSLGGEWIDTSRTARIALSLVSGAAFLAAKALLEPPAEQGGTLSGREREILAWTAAGHHQGDIAATLGLSERTIENHLRRIRRRLGAATTAQAIRVAIRTGDIVT